MFSVLVLNVIQVVRKQFEVQSSALVLRLSSVDVFSVQKFGEMKIRENKLLGETEN